MNIGDKVRYLYGKEEGIVVKIKGDRAEVEDSHGFVEEFLQKDLVVVAKEESFFFSKAIAEKKEPQLVAEKGLFVCFVPHADEVQFTMYLSNNTDLDWPITLVEEHTDMAKGLTATLLKARSIQQVKEISLQNFEKWPAWVFTALYLKKGEFIPKAPLVKKLAFSAKKFFGELQTVPLLSSQKGYLFQIDSDSTFHQTKPEQLKEKLIESPAIASTKESKKVLGSLQDLAKVNSKEVDLHMEAIDPKLAQAKPDHILTVQLDTFERELSSAIANAYSEVIFIHGLGSGRLKDELHKRLSGHYKKGLIKSFEDARKDKFGYGATLVKL